MLNNMVVVITGGVGYLGAPMAEGVVAAGGRVVIADVNMERAQELAAVLNQGVVEPRAIAVKMDITSLNDVQASLVAAEKAFGQIDALVNSAYPMNPQYGNKLDEVTYESFCENVNMHLGGYFLTSQQYAKYFASKGAGNVINLSSIYGVIPPRFEIYEGTPMTMPVEYAAIKSGIQLLSQYFCKFYKGKGVRFNVLSPGGILGGQPEAFLEKYNALCMSKGMLDPIDLVGSLVFLLSDASRYISGQNIVVDDGFTL